MNVGSSCFSSYTLCSKKTNHFYFCNIPLPTVTAKTVMIGQRKPKILQQQINNSDVVIFWNTVQKIKWATFFCDTACTERTRRAAGLRLRSPQRCRRSSCRPRGNISETVSWSCSRCPDGWWSKVARRRTRSSDTWTRWTDSHPARPVRSPQQHRESFSLFIPFHLFVQNDKYNSG